MKILSSWSGKEKSVNVYVTWLRVKRILAILDSREFWNPVLDKTLGTFCNEDTFVMVMNGEESESVYSQA